jgi:hypothetical protein
MINVSVAFTTLFRKIVGNSAEDYFRVEYNAVVSGCYFDQWISNVNGSSNYFAVADESYPISNTNYLAGSLLPNVSRSVRIDFPLRYLMSLEANSQTEVEVVRGRWIFVFQSLSRVSVSVYSPRESDFGSLHGEQGDFGVLFGSSTSGGLIKIRAVANVSIELLAIDWLQTCEPGRDMNTHIRTSFWFSC